MRSEDSIQHDIHNQSTCKILKTCLVNIQKGIVSLTEIGKLIFLGNFSVFYRSFFNGSRRFFYQPEKDIT